LNKILDIASLEKNFLDKIFDLTATISNDWPNVEQIGAGKTICLLFWEPSTRTKLSFEHAAKKLGFNVLDFSPEHSSVKKGESFEDTILTLLAMQVDGFIIRHPEDHISKKISSMMPENVFYINAGDGNHAHPTQAMLDVFTMNEKFNDLSNLKVTILGDVNHSRVIPSQIELLKKYSCSDINFIGPESLISKKFSPSFSEIPKDFLINRDILFILRIQKERFKDDDDLDETNFIKNFQVNEEFIKNTGFNGYLMHPGPMNIDAEITRNVANGKNSLVLKQVENGLYLRTALLSLML
jgi:aspartate carbamoyltransferase catalytic subunit|tara:strand:+ start:3250 stop:4140 length:891 start_codon:yes stop_codon:yes gene_type:complete